MPTDAELEGLETQLGAFQKADQQHHQTLQNLLHDYQTLVESHRRLKSDYEEEKESREKYKKLARGQVCIRRETLMKFCSACIIAF